MLTNEQLEQLRTSLEASQNPLFFFDNDADGFCAYIILKRVLGRGKGVQIKTYPDLNSQYIHKVNELNPDTVVVLDKSDISEDFIDTMQEKNIPIIWIDHHPTNTKPEYIQKTEYYNSGESAEPTTYITQKIFNREEDLWLAMVGCIADVYKPDFAKKFEKKYPELYSAHISAFHALHATEIGKFSLMINFGLMNSISNVLKLARYLEKAKTPYDLLEENFYTRDFHTRYRDLKSELDKLVQKAYSVTQKNPKVIYFSYSGQTSMSAILSNQLYFDHPEKLIIVAYKKPEKINLSIRGLQALEFTKKMIEEIPDTTGGGHEEATGAMVPSLELEKFEQFIEKF